jgi:hypothetical protein
VEKAYPQTKGPHKALSSFAHTQQPLGWWKTRRANRHASPDSCLLIGDNLPLVFLLPPGPLPPPYPSKISGSAALEYPGNPILEEPLKES